MQSLRQATAQRMQCKAAANQPRKPHGSAVELGMRTMFSRVTCSWNLQELGRVQQANWHARQCIGGALKPLDMAHALQAGARPAVCTNKCVPPEVEGIAQVSAPVHYKGRGHLNVPAIAGKGARQAWQQSGHK